MLSCAASEDGVPVPFLWVVARNPIVRERRMNEIECIGEMTPAMTPPAEQTEREVVLARLAAIPARIARTVEGWDAAQLAAPPHAGEWPAQAIPAHLRAADDILAPRAFMVLVRDNLPLASYDERRWGAIAGYGQADFRASLALYTARRAELVGALQRLAPGDWLRSGTHETRGPVTLLDLMCGLADHEEEHAAQLETLAP